MMRRLLVTLAAVAAACGPVDFSTYVPPDNGKLCYDDADCAPNGCCGMGTAIVHKDDAPDCSAASCTGSCPVNGIKCGCAVPLCRNSRCVAAISPTPDC